MQTTITMRTTVIRKTKGTKNWQRCGEKEHWYSAGENVNWHRHYRKQYEMSSKIKYQTPLGMKLPYT